MILKDVEIFSDGKISGKNWYVEYRGVSYVRIEFENNHKWTYNHDTKPPILLSIDRLEELYQQMMIVESRNMKIEKICS